MIHGRFWLGHHYYFMPDVVISTAAVFPQALHWAPASVFCVVILCWIWVSLSTSATQLGSDAPPLLVPLLGEGTSNLLLGSIPGQCCMDIIFAPFWLWFFFFFGLRGLLPISAPEVVSLAIDSLHRLSGGTWPLCWGPPAQFTVPSISVLHLLCFQSLPAYFFFYLIEGWPSRLL